MAPPTPTWYDGAMARRPKVKVAITIAPSIVNRIDAAARVLKLSRSAWMEQACRAALDESEQLVKVMGDEVVRRAMVKALGEPGVLASIARSMVGDVDEAKQQRLLEFFKEASERVEVKR